MSAVASGVAEQYHHRLGLLEHRFWVHWQHRHLYRQEEGIFIAWGRTILTASLFCRRATTRLLVRVGQKRGSLLPGNSYNHWSAN